MAGSKGQRLIHSANSLQNRGDSSRTILLRSNASLPLSHGGKDWSGGWESNPRLESHNLPSWPLDDLRHKTWRRRYESNVDCRGFNPVPNLSATTALVEKEGIEPSSTGCRPVILPLNDFPMIAGIGVEPIYGAYETPGLAASPAGNKLVRPHRLERWFLANRASVLAAVRRAHGAEAGNRTQAGRLPSDCSATELQRLEPSVRIELTSPIYRTGASPSMLTRLETLVRGTGLEPVSMPWQGNILAARRTQHWSGRRESNSVDQLGRLGLNQ